MSCIEIQIHHMHMHLHIHIHMHIHIHHTSYIGHKFIRHHTYQIHIHKHACPQNGWMDSSFNALITQVGVGTHADLEKKGFVKAAVVPSTT